MIINRASIVLIILVSVAVLGFAQDMLLTANARDTSRPILGLKLYGHRISQYDKPALAENVKEILELNRQTLVFRYNSQDFQISRGDVGAKYDPGLIAEGLLLVGRRDSLLKRIWIQDRAWLGLYSQKVIAIDSNNLLANKIAGIGKSVFQPADPPQLDFVNDINRVISGRDGIKIDAQSLAKAIKENILYPPRQPLSLPTQKVSSQHTPEELEPLKKEALSLTEEPIQIVSAGQIFTLNRDDLLSMLKVVERLDSKNYGKTKLVLRLDDEKLNRKLSDYAKKVEEITEAEFDDHDARVLIYSQFFSGTRRLAEVPTGSRPLPKAKKAKTKPDKVSAVSLAANISLAQNDSSPEKYVYLTFDDGPNDIYHPLILDILKKYNVKATFFLVGENSQKYKEVAKRTIAEGHAIGNHSLTHAFLPKQTSKKIFDEINNTKNILTLINDNKEIYMFRPPYGGINKDVSSDVTDLKLKMFLWDVDPRDWSDPAVDELVSRVLDHVRNSSDILLHSNHQVTVQALPKIIEGLQAKGYSFKLLQ